MSKGMILIMTCGDQYYNYYYYSTQIDDCEWWTRRGDARDLKYAQLVFMV